MQINLNYLYVLIKEIYENEVITKMIEILRVSWFVFRTPENGPS
jgi:hypothetical protein